MQQHGDKIREHVVLQSVADSRIWTVKVFVNYPNKRPQFVFNGAKWKAFVVSNGLVEGDRLKFTLVAMSKFEVLILCRGGSKKVLRPSVQGPVMQSKGSAFSKTSQLPEKSLEPQHRDVAGKVKREPSAEVFAEKGDREGGGEDIDAFSASDASQSPSDMDFNTFER